MARQSAGLAPGVSLVLASAFWALGTVVAKELLTLLPPIAFLVLQLAPSVVVLWLVVLATGAGRPAWRELPGIALLGVLNPGLSYTLSMLGLATTSASVATLLWAAEPALIIVLAWFLLRERMSGRLIGLTAVAAAGVLVVSGLLELESMAGDAGYGAALILAGVLCCALYTVLSRRIVMTADPLVVVAVQQTAGLAWAAAIWPLEGSSPAALLALPGAAILSGVASGLMYYVAAFWCYLRALRSVPASTAGMFLNLIPLFGVATAYLLLGERLTPVQWAGAAAIVLSVWALLGARRHPAEAATG